MTVRSFELPARSAPNQTIPTWPFVSAAIHGKTFAFPAVAAFMFVTLIAGAQVVPRSVEKE